MDINRLTEKAQAALREAQSVAVRFGHQQIEAEHVLLALLDQENGLAPAILAKSDVSADALKIRVHRDLERQPKVSGGGSETPGVGGRLNRLLVQAEDEAKRLKDDFVSVEHLLLAMRTAHERAAAGSRPAARHFAKP